jgi:hypothetical protein
VNREEEIEALKEGIRDRQHHIDELLQEMKYMAYCLEDMKETRTENIFGLKHQTYLIKKFLESRMKDNRSGNRFGFHAGVIE